MKDSHINYIEFYANNLEVIKTFYNTCFGWEFTDYGSGYVSFSNSGVLGGFQKTDDKIINGTLVVLYHKDLKTIQDDIIKAGGKISKDIFAFPGGRRFQFLDPSGNELAVWSEV